MKTSMFLSQLTGFMEAVSVPDQFKGTLVTGKIANAISMKAMGTPDWDINKSMAEYYREIDKLAGGCEELITSHKKVKTLIEISGAQTAEGKAKAATELENNRRKMAELLAEIERLKPLIEKYEKDDKHRNDESQALNRLGREIDERKNSANNYIPFYGIAYATETNNIIRKYNSRVNAWNVLNEMLNKTREEYHKNKAKDLDANRKLQELKAANDRLQNEGGKICELLTILGRLIEAFQTFIVNVSEIKSKLNHSLIECIRQANALLDESLTEITTYSKMLNMKIKDYSPELPKEIVKELEQLAA